MILYFLTLVLFVMGVYCLIAKKNIIKKIIGLTITDYAINLFIIIIGYRAKGIAPIMFKNMTDTGARRVRGRSAAAGAGADLHRDRSRRALAHDVDMPAAVREVQNVRHERNQQAQRVERIETQ